MLKKIVDREKKISSEISGLAGDLAKVTGEKKKEKINSRIAFLRKLLKDENDGIPGLLSRVSAEMSAEKIRDMKSQFAVQEKAVTYNVTRLEMETIRRLGDGKKRKKKFREKSKSYMKFSDRFFSGLSDSVIDSEVFRLMKRDLFKSNLMYSPKGYVSMIFFTTMISFIVSVFVAAFFLFFDVVPYLAVAGDPFGGRIMRVFWIPVVFPPIVFLSMLFYPSAERKSLEKKIDTELPFATIHMSAISSSSIEPSRIFTIIVSTNEYPSLQKEFTKLINDINVHGYDLVTALRNSSSRSPSRKLSELYGGLVTTITSGGVLSDFFDQRSQTLMLDYTLNREKETKANETFMDIYISIVIAAPMVLMLLLIMMQISGLGISLSSTTITMIMIGAVAMINVVFLTFLQLRKPREK